ncbi:helix-turn-helix transcriptional regulator [Streptomyces carpaticus]|uniref:helix-turn-helix domain-containing protein n=1 Tax=Streptomyces carpaticus TaxID=285558 RepID=UPI0021FCE203|nr:helix-turn-helix transcriptional regulator [Streptomyces carpaticus]
MISSSNTQQARAALAQRLREIRKDAGLTARELAARAGWHESKCSRLENGRTLPSDSDLRTWTRHCDATDLAADLIATARNIQGAYVEWQRMERSGLRRAQESVLPVWERTRHFRTYASAVFPGLLQTRAYTGAVLRSIKDRRVPIDDVEAAVQVRMDKQRLLYDGPRRFAFLLEESVLRNRIGKREDMAELLGNLLRLAKLPNLSLGVIPLDADRTGMWPVESFWLFDDDQVNVELVAAYLTVTQPNEVAAYARTFAALADLAVHGDAARRLIEDAVEALSEPGRAP